MEAEGEESAWLCVRAVSAPPPAVLTNGTHTAPAGAAQCTKAALQIKSVRKGCQAERHHAAGARRLALINKARRSQC